MPTPGQVSAAILKAVRDAGGKTTFNTLISRLSAAASFVPPGAAGDDGRPNIQAAWHSLDNSGFAIQNIYKSIADLRDLGLIEIELVDAVSNSPSIGSIRLRSHFYNLQRTLGFSLSETINRQDNSILATPVFPRPSPVAADIFAIMPFAAEFDDVFREIADTAKKCGRNVRRADEIFGASHVIHDIWSLLYGCRLVICDCTNRNPNVFYELGMAHTLGRPVLLITQKEQDVPFDLRHWRYIVYTKGDGSLEKLLSPSFAQL